MADWVSSFFSPTAVTRLASANFSKAAIGGEYEVVLSAKSRHQQCTSRRAAVGCSESFMFQCQNGSNR